MSSSAPLESTQGLMRYVLNLSLPMAWSRFIQMIGWFAGMMLIAHLGITVLAASALISSIQITCNVFFMSALFAVGVVAGRLYGERRWHDLGTLLHQGLVFSVLVGLVLTILFLNIKYLLALTNQPPELVVICDAYFKVLAWSSVPLMVLVTLQQFCYGILQQRIVILHNVISLIAFLPCAYWLIFGGWGMPRLGVAGLALAMIFQLLLNLVTLSYHIAQHGEFARYHIFQRRKNLGLNHIKTLFVVGWPMAIQFGGELVALSVLTLFTGWISLAALAASQITLQIYLLLLVPLFAISEAAGILISQAIGGKQHHLIVHISRICLILTIVAVLLTSLLFFAIPDQLAALFIDIHNPANRLTLQLTRWLFYLSTFCLLMDALRNLYMGMLRGFYDTRYPMWLGLIALWVIAVPLGYVMAFTWDWGVIGIRLAITVGMTFGAIAVWGRWRLKLKSEINK